MKKIIGLDEKMLALGMDEDQSHMPTRRVMLRSIGNIKADNADAARRVRRIISIIRDPAVTDLLLETDDYHFIEQLFEANAMNLPAWMQGQLLELIASAERVETKPA